jgi:hypothetical protein
MSEAAAKSPPSPSETRREFDSLVGTIANTIGDKPLDKSLEKFLNEAYPPKSDTFQRLAGALKKGTEEGWLCGREHGGIKFGRPVKPGEQAGKFSVDVVLMDTIKGPHHVHTTGEIGMIVPVSGTPKFDGKGEGWYVYGPGSAHHPTVTEGKAYVLYLLPDGAIEFTGR